MYKAKIYGDRSILDALGNESLIYAFANNNQEIVITCM